MIVPLHAANPSAMTGAGNWTYLVAGRHPVLIDAGVGHPSHIAAVAHACPAGPAHILVSHAHGDHISGAPALSARWPRARFSKMPWPERDAHYSVAWDALSDDETISAGDDDELVALHTPGHAPDHMAFWQASTRTIFSGDLVVSGTTVVIPASSGGSLVAYLRSLHRLLSLDPVQLLPAHGPPIDNPRQIIQHYIAHRHQREEQVVAALRSGARSLEAMVRQIYVGLAPALVPMARESVLAHLHKLEAERVAVRHGEDWTLY